MRKRTQFGKIFAKSKSEEIAKAAMLVLNILGEQI
jgi:hypothetical protein